MLRDDASPPNCIYPDNPDQRPSTSSQTTQQFGIQSVSFDQYQQQAIGYLGTETPQQCFQEQPHLESYLCSVDQNGVNNEPNISDTYPAQREAQIIADVVLDRILGSEISNSQRNTSEPHSRVAIPSTDIDTPDSYTNQQIRSYPQIQNVLASARLLAQNTLASQLASPIPSNPQLNHYENSSQPLNIQVSVDVSIDSNSYQQSHDSGFQQISDQRTETFYTPGGFQCPPNPNGFSLPMNTPEFANAQSITPDPPPPPPPDPIIPTAINPALPQNTETVQPQPISVSQIPSISDFKFPILQPVHPQNIGSYEVQTITQIPTIPGHQKTEKITPGGSTFPQMQFRHSTDFPILYEQTCPVSSVQINSTMSQIPDTQICAFPNTQPTQFSSIPFTQLMSDLSAIPAPTIPPTCQSQTVTSTQTLSIPYAQMSSTLPPHFQPDTTSYGGQNQNTFVTQTLPNTYQPPIQITQQHINQQATQFPNISVNAQALPPNIIDLPSVGNTQTLPLPELPSPMEFVDPVPLLQPSMYSYTSQSETQHIPAPLPLNDMYPLNAHSSQQVSQVRNMSTKSPSQDSIRLVHTQTNSIHEVPLVQTGTNTCVPIDYPEFHCQSTVETPSLQSVHEIPLVKTCPNVCALEDCPEFHSQSTVERPYQQQSVGNAMDNQDVQLLRLISASSRNNTVMIARPTDIREMREELDRIESRIDKWCEDFLKQIPSIGVNKENKKPSSSNKKANACKSLNKRRTRIPPKSLSVLQKWFADHASDPYPTAEQKVTLSEEANLTRQQVSTWLTNTRKRRWAPFILKKSSRSSSTGLKLQKTSKESAQQSVANAVVVQGSLDIHTIPSSSNNQVYPAQAVELNDNNTMG
eukprot:892302_1